MEKSVQELSYEKYMWDKLIPIGSYNRHGITQLNALKQFGSAINKLVLKFTKDLGAAAS
jgi:hypothetical protein